MYRSNSLKHRLYIGTGLLVAVCLLSNLLGYLGQEYLLGNVRENERAEQITSDLLALDQYASDLKSKSESYVQTGSEAQYEAARLTQSILLDQIDDLQTKTDRDVLLDLLRRMRAHIDEFGDELTIAASERKIRTDLVQDGLIKQEREVDAAFANMEKRLMSSASIEDSQNLISAIRDYETAGKRLLRYFIEPDTRQYEQLLDELDRSQSKIRDINVAATADDSDAPASTAFGGDGSEQVQAQAPIQTAKENLLRAIADFSSLTVRAVQATRGYMYYVNVVMAGEISEFVYYSNQLKRFVADQKQANQIARSNAIGRGRWIRIIVSVATVLVATVLAVRMSNQLFDPILSMTNTFRRLADGETVKLIPAAVRDDEIGRMAQAAEVFSRNNEQTRQLLAHSQILSEQLVEKANALEASNLELDNFAYVASHDLKSPLRGLRSLAQWVIEDCDETLAEQSKEHLTMMQGRVDKMEMLLDDLLAYSRIGRFKIKPETVDAEEMVRSLVDILDNPNRINVAIKGQLPVLETLKQPLQQIMLNLISNAVKYNDKSADGSVVVSCAEEADHVVFEIRDNGSGFPPKFSQRIFQMFQRGSTSSSNVDGSGMGLAICKKLVESVGGDIEASSVVGQGATFRFRWPKQISRTQIPPTPTSIGSASNSFPKGAPL